MFDLDMSADLGERSQHPGPLATTDHGRGPILRVADALMPGPDPRVIGDNAPLAERFTIRRLTISSIRRPITAGQTGWSLESILT